MKKSNQYFLSKFGAGLLLLTAIFLQPIIVGSQTMSIEEYEPKSTLVVPGTIIKKAKYPFIDVHNHQPLNPKPEDLAKMVNDMDALNMKVMVNLSGTTGNTLAEGVKNYKGKYPTRFITFANLDFKDIDEPGYGERAAKQLEQDVKNGAQGLKFFKNWGLTVTDKNGKRIPTDDPRLDPVFEKCAELGIPVLIHTGEPRSFFDPQDKFNERWLELKQFPDRARPADKYPSWETVMGEQHHLFAKHPKTIFIAAHLGWLGGDLARLGALLDKLPNVYTEVAAVVAELGRQPRFAHDWFIKYQDRVLFGKDTWAPEEYYTYFRIFESSDEYFDYFRKRHAFWKMYGLNLPDQVLKKLYYKNALKIIPGIDKKLFPN
ncbi:MAG TPA: amidohydrolase family protein [Pyrinomonadaceae bacterium]|nr:amidohydrolase family protein [Pyrinomonadaceae bacterium]